uniref:RING-type domain-containing protein n=1 Tax=Corethron hystrix TaxID=216773 RepID=A0A6U5JM18_9STRA|mmetsp:Transcript_37709/g.87832  ORF Transcript_37709/g.87832 Transcript_37709/m.87832 type:complete len:487 (+) Transcript_37709:144-1604(+)
MSKRTVSVLFRELIALLFGVFELGYAIKVNNDNIHDLVYNATYLQNSSRVSDNSVNYLNTSLVTNMSEVFAFLKYFNQNLDMWDTSRTTDMSSMFSHASQFNGEIGTWDTSQVLTMSKMLASAVRFDSEISYWDTSKVIDMSSLFSYCYSFNRDIGQWDVGRVKDMGEMFGSAYNFNQNLSVWDVSSVEDMSSLFRYASGFNSDLNSWNTSMVTDMNGLFFHAKKFNGDISSWNTSKVVSMARMFTNAESFNVDLSHWDVSRVNNFQDIFNDTLSFNRQMCWDIEEYAMGKNGLLIDSGGKIFCGRTRVVEANMYAYMFAVAGVLGGISFALIILQVVKQNGLTKNGLTKNVKFDPFDMPEISIDVKRKILQKIFRPKIFSRSLVLNNKMKHGLAISPDDMDCEFLATNSNFKCIVCLQPCRYGEKVLCSNVCSHIFHYDCIIDWLVQNNTCPVCPCSMYTDDQIFQGVMLHFPELLQNNQDIIPL